MNNPWAGVCDFAHLADGSVSRSARRRGGCGSLSTLGVVRKAAGIAGCRVRQQAKTPQQMWFRCR